MTEHILTGFGFGPIQAGLFAKEAFQSGNFARIVVSEIDAELVEAVRANKGSYRVNVAKSDSIEVLKVDNVELLDPNVEADRKALLEVLPQSTEIATCLPSVSFYEAGRTNNVASLIAEGLEHNNATGTIIYASENNNHAAEMLEKAVGQGIGGQIPRNVRFLNTVIGKMSRAVTEPAEIAELGLETIAPGLERAFLVEQFNRILVSRAQIPDFKPGIEVFIEKDDLLPFEEAKLYGHNAIHSLLGFIGAVKGCTSMTELKDDEAVMQIGRAAFLQESGAALVRKYAHLDDEL
ncbi:MAG: mannitol-1-phosphate 5-dehydrogenase, partial [Planctomycetota bacterium]